MAPSRSSGFPELRYAGAMASPSSAALLDAVNLKQLEKALADGADINATDDDGTTKIALLCKSKTGAMSKTEEAMALLLIERGAEVMKGDKRDTTPLHRAARS